MKVLLRKLGQPQERRCRKRWRSQGCRRKFLNWDRSWAKRPSRNRSSGSTRYLTGSIGWMYWKRPGNGCGLTKAHLGWMASRLNRLWGQTKAQRDFWKGFRSRCERKPTGHRRCNAFTYRRRMGSWGRWGSRRYATG